MDALGFFDQPLERLESATFLHFCINMQITASISQRFLEGRQLWGLDTASQKALLSYLD